MKKAPPKRGPERAVFLNLILALVAPACTMSQERIVNETDRAITALENLNRPPPTVKVTVPKPTVIEKTVHVENPVDVDALLKAADDRFSAVLDKQSSDWDSLLTSSAAALSKRLDATSRALARLEARDDEHRDLARAAEEALGARLGATEKAVAALKARPTALVDRKDFSKEQLEKFHELAGQIAEGKAAAAIKATEEGYLTWLRDNWALVLLALGYAGDRSGALGGLAKKLGLKAAKKA